MVQTGRRKELLDEKLGERGRGIDDSSSVGWSRPRKRSRTSGPSSRRDPYVAEKGEEPNPGLSHSMGTMRGRPGTVGGAGPRPAVPAGRSSTPRRSAGPRTAERVAIRLEDRRRIRADGGSARSANVSARPPPCELATAARRLRHGLIEECPNVVNCPQAGRRDTVVGWSPTASRWPIGRSLAGRRGDGRPPHSLAPHRSLDRPPATDQHTRESGRCSPLGPAGVGGSRGETTAHETTPVSKIPGRLRPSPTFASSFFSQDFSVSGETSGRAAAPL